MELKSPDLASRLDAVFGRLAPPPAFAAQTNVTGAGWELNSVASGTFNAGMDLDMEGGGGSSEDEEAPPPAAHPGMMAGSDDEDDDEEEAEEEAPRQRRRGRPGRGGSGGGERCDGGLEEDLLPRPSFGEERRKVRGIGRCG